MVLSIHVPPTLDDVVRAYEQYKTLIESHRVKKEEAHATTLATKDVKTDDALDFV